MQGHKISGTRQWNRHWQSAGGGVPPVPVYPSFGDLQANILFIQGYIPEYYQILSDDRCDLHGGYLDGIFCFLDENRIYFEYMNMLNFNSDRFIIPCNFEVQLKDKAYFNSNDLYAQYPSGFHNVSMRKSTLNFFGEDIEFYELVIDTSHNFDECYIEYDLSRANINNFEADAYVMNATGGDNTRAYFDTWHFAGHPYPPADLYNIHSTFKYENSVNNLYVRKTNPHAYPVPTYTGMFMPAYWVFTYYSTYDLNDLYRSYGSFNFSLDLELHLLMANSLSMEGIGLPPFTSLHVTASNAPRGYYDNGNYIYYCQYEGIDVDTFDYFVYFDMVSNNDDTVLSRVKLSWDY